MAYNPCFSYSQSVILNLFQDLPMKNYYYVYILSNYTLSTLYIGVNNNIEKRIHEHRTNNHNGFTKKYHTTKLVYFEVYQSVKGAIQREKQLKNWHHSWKFNLIKSKNKRMENLLEDPEINSG